MKLYGNGVLLNGMTEQVTLERNRGEAAATLTADLITAVGDTYFQKESLSLGDVVRLLDDEEKECFLGAVQMLRRTPETVRLVACDRGLFLTQNQLHGVFAGSGADIVKAVGRQLGLAVGQVDAPAAYRCVTANTGESAFSLLRRAVGEDREITLSDGALTVRKWSGNVYRLPPEHVLAAEGLADIRKMVNRAVVVDYKKRVVATAQNSEELKAYGQRQRILGKQGSDPQTQAKAALQGKVLGGTVTLWGDLNYRCGDAVELHRSAWGMAGVYRITAVQHRWKAGAFTTELTLEGIR